MELLYMALFTASNILCFVIGAKVGQKVTKGERVEIPSPVKVVQEYKAERAAKTEQSKIDTIMRNIESYNGTPYGQEDVSGG
jgi:hypothetical protein